METDCLGIRLLFEDVISRPRINHTKLLELAKAINTEYLIISIVACGKFLSVSDPPTPHETSWISSSASRAGKQFGAPG
jgi:hypothetical protein